MLQYCSLLDASSFDSEYEIEILGDIDFVYIDIQDATMGKPRELQEIEKHFGDAIGSLDHGVQLVKAEFIFQPKTCQCELFNALLLLDKTVTMVF